MQDFESRGNGNSRYLKSVSDFLTQYPNYEAFAQALVDGTLPVDFNGYNPNGISQRGTPYSKANILTDATAALFGLGSSATPNQVFEALGKGTSGSGGYYVVCETAADNPIKAVAISGKAPKEGTRITVQFVNGCGYMSNMQLAVTYDGGSATNYVMNGDALRAVSTYWGLHSTVSFVFAKTITSLGSTTWYWQIDAPVSLDSAYQTRGTYTGNGAYGSGSPLSFTLSGYPTFGAILRTSAPVSFGLIINRRMVSYIDGTFYRLSNGTSSNNVYTWYSADSAKAQLNVSDAQYVYSFLLASA